MKVIQLGCGITGLVCAEQLANNKKITELILADLNTKNAEALANRMKKDNVSVEKVDASDDIALKRLLKDADIVISSVSWTLNRKVMSKAIETKTNYVDFSLTLGWDEALKEKNIATDADVTVLTCMGSDPGITDVFARHSADILDQVDEIRTIDGDNGAVEGLDFFTLWSPTDMMDEVSMPAGIFKDGVMTYVPELSTRQVYDFPAPIGSLPVYNTDHEETYLMSHLIEGVKNVDFRIAIDDSFVTIAKSLRTVGMHKRDPIDVKGVKVVPLDVLAALMPNPTDFADKVKGYGGVVVETTGLLKGKRTMVKMWIFMSHEKAYEISKVNATGYLVGVPGAIGTEMIIDGEISQKGLVFPEMIPANRFIERMREKGLKVNEQVIELQ
ncbi:MAG: saccharopine dehydrogenase NADP-binding domain-containing protein [Thermoplasmata archaeon]|nr:saccharopine dehydrogenase NADP-binding domain-containing protein [Thermoplasmata archaeon]